MDSHGTASLQLCTMLSFMYVLLGVSGALHEQGADPDVVNVGCRKKTKNIADMIDVEGAGMIRSTPSTFAAQSTVCLGITHDL